MKSVAALAAGVLLSGLMLALALPPHGFSLLGWFFLVPVTISLGKKGFAFGFVSGVLISLIAALFDASGFLLPSGVSDGTTDWIYAGFLLFGLVVGVSLGVWSASPKLQARPWLMAGWAVLFEAALLVYLPAHLALTQSRSTAMLFLASWIGIWGVSYLVWLANFWIVVAPAKKRWIFCLTAVVFTITAPYPINKGDLLVAMIQTRQVDKHELAVLNAQAGRQVTISVWPELSGEIDIPGREANALLSISRRADEPPFITTYEEPGTSKPYNVARIFSATGASGGYRKRKPFAGETQMHAAGKEPAAVTVNGVTYGMNICFDSCFPSIIRDTARLPHVDVILLPTLDPDTKFGVIQAIHAAYTPFRAAELGVPIVRADITAHSMAVDSYGRILKDARTATDDVSLATIEPGKRWTFETYAGDWFLIVCAALAILSFRRTKAKSVNPLPSDAKTTSVSCDEPSSPALRG